MLLVLLLIFVGIKVRPGSGDDPTPLPTLTPGAGMPTAVLTPPSASLIGLPSGGGLATGTPGSGTPGPVMIGNATFGPVVFTTSVDPSSQAPASDMTKIPSSATDVYAVLALHNVPAGTVIDATWAYDGNPISSLSSSATLPTDATDTWIAFRINRFDTGTPEPATELGWPDGEYQVTIMVNGQQAQQATVRINRSFDASGTPESDTPAAENGRGSRATR